MGTRAAKRAEERDVAKGIAEETGGEPVIVRHADHDPEIACRPAGHGLCEPAPEGVRLIPWREAYERKTSTEDGCDACDA